MELITLASAGTMQVNVSILTATKTNIIGYCYVATTGEFRK
jgi:hypothetical protein